MGPIENALKEKFFLVLFRGEEINADFRKILGHSVKHGSLGTLGPRLAAEIACNTSILSSGKLIDSLL